MHHIAASLFLPLILPLLAPQFSITAIRIGFRGLSDRVRKIIAVLRLTGIPVNRACRILLALGTALTITSCSVPGKIDTTLEILNNGINALENQSATWQNVLEETRDKLIAEGRSTIANEVNQVLTKAISDVGVEARCFTDFLRHRVAEDLRRLRASITNEKIELEPVFCNPNPSVVDMNLKPDRRTYIEISGYNLDVARLKVFLEKVQEPRVEVTHALANPSRYLLTLDLGHTGVPLTSSSKLLVFELPNNQHQTVNIIQPSPPGPATLRITFVSVDVYLDGSGGKDTWDLQYSVNDAAWHFLWNRRRDVEDACSAAYGPGPAGDRNACRYSDMANNTFALTVRPNEEVTIRVKGRAYDDNHPVELASKTFYPDNKWGAGGGSHTIDGKRVYRVGAAHRRDTEYFVYFSIDCVGGSCQ